MNSRDFFPPGSLAVVATPLGNPDDFSPRAVEALRRADLVAAEDTRSATRLLSPHGISPKFISYHDWNERGRVEGLIAKLKEGQRVAVISEAGTPAISDPGYDIVRSARLNGIRVVPVPGPSALTAFLSVSGLATDAFSFFGFPPNRTGKRRLYYQRYVEREETLVFYESPRRIEAALADALEVFGDREASLGREMTKNFEECFFGPLSTTIDDLKKISPVRGEIVWGIRGATREDRLPTEDELEELVTEAAASGEPLRPLAKKLATQTGMGAKELYSMMQKLRNA
jgi:16S rRNA (cytidine1402-2'-O)-methyltransferase